MRFNLLKCRSAQPKFDIYWTLGHNKFVNYFTKYHLATHHNALQAIYIALDSAEKQLVW